MACEGHRVFPSGEWMVTAPVFVPRRTRRRPNPHPLPQNSPPAAFQNDSHDNGPRLLMSIQHQNIHIRVKTPNTRFCPERHQLSKQLPEVVRSLEYRKCFYTRRDNYFIAEFDGVPKGCEYWVFFDVRKIAPQTVIVWIESAYLGAINDPPSGRKRQKVAFRVLVRKALENTRANPPP
jgi:hypothetical protein